MNHGDPFEDVDNGRVGVKRVMKPGVVLEVMNKPAPNLTPKKPKGQADFHLQTEIIARPLPDLEDEEPKPKANVRVGMQLMNRPDPTKKSKVPPSIGSMSP